MLEVESSFHNMEGGISMDHALIRVCKRLVSLSLQQSQNCEFNGLSVKDAILLTYPDVR